MREAIPLIKMINANKYCQRCGNCCSGLIWRKKISFRRAFVIAEGINKKQDIEKKLISHYKIYLNKKGQKMEKPHPLEWDNKNKTVLIQAKVSKCRYLSFTKDNKAFCIIYEDRPNECKSYLCKKVRRKVMLEKIKEKERSTSLLAYSKKKLEWAKTLT